MLSQRDLGARTDARAVRGAGVCRFRSILSPDAGRSRRIEARGFQGHVGYSRPGATDSVAWGKQAGSPPGHASWPLPRYAHLAYFERQPLPGCRGFLPLQDPGWSGRHPNGRADREVLVAVNAPERTPRLADEDASDTSPLASCLVRLGWMGARNAALLLLTVSIIQEPSWTTAKDAAFCSIVTTVVVLRYVDVTGLGGRTAHGERATRRHLVRPAVALVVLSAVLWTIAQSVQSWPNRGEVDVSRSEPSSARSPT
jgi:hypothetical protein